jgi:hypothetical protein
MSQHDYRALASFQIQELHERIRSAAVAGNQINLTADELVLLCDGLDLLQWFLSSDLVDSSRVLEGVGALVRGSRIGGATGASPRTSASSPTATSTAATTAKASSATVDSDTRSSGNDAPVDDWYDTSWD